MHAAHRHFPTIVIIGYKLKLAMKEINQNA